MIDKSIWLKVEKEFVNGKKPREIAKKYGVSEDYLYKKIKDGGWREKREKKRQKTIERIAEKTDEKVIEKQSDIISDALSECYKQAADIVAITSKALQEITQKEYNKTKQERRIATDEDGNTVEITEKTESGYIASSNIQASKLHTLTKTLETAVNILQGVAHGADPQQIQLVIDKGDFENWSK